MFIDGALDLRLQFVKRYHWSVVGQSEFCNLIGRVACCFQHLLKKVFAIGLLTCKFFV